ncbi:MAG TPA: PIN domain-containing protein [Acidobacteriaceae bacterium]|nr:PIN domain-containing protein [Acidobacteriaceae bacterium]
MESAVLGLVLDSSVLVAAERAQITTPEAIRKVRAAVGDVDIVISALTVAELAHGIYRADTPQRSRMRRQFLDELKAHVPAHPITDATAEIIARVGAEQASKGIILPLADLIIGACAIELGYAVGTNNLRDFSRIPGLNIIRL